ncbi:MAG: hypothetical protein JW885_15790 [Deltaproteobacteria bacterium]|nr:hypothetical protein [Candidatus Zymogenaceae bacterium]
MMSILIKQRFRKTAAVTALLVVMFLVAGFSLAWTPDENTSASAEIPDEDDVTPPEPKYKDIPARVCGEPNEPKDVVSVSKSGGDWEDLFCQDRVWGGESLVGGGEGGKSGDKIFTGPGGSRVSLRCRKTDTLISLSHMSWIEIKKLAKKTEIDKETANEKKTAVTELKLYRGTVDIKIGKIKKSDISTDPDNRKSGMPTELVVTLDNPKNRKKFNTTVKYVLEDDSKKPASPEDEVPAVTLPVGNYGEVKVKFEKETEGHVSFTLIEHPGKDDTLEMKIYVRKEDTD